MKLNIQYLISPLLHLKQHFIHISCIFHITAFISIFRTKPEHQHMNPAIASFQIFKVSFQVPLIKIPHTLSPPYPKFFRLVSTCSSSERYLLPFAFSSSTTLAGALLIKP